MIYFIGGSRQRPEVISHEIQMSGNSSANVDGGCCCSPKRLSPGTRILCLFGRSKSCEEENFKLTYLFMGRAGHLQVDLRGIRGRFINV